MRLSGAAWFTLTMMTASRFDGEGGVETLEGVLERITFTNEENAWSVVKIAVPGKRDLVTVVGNLLGVQPGESLRLNGRWILDKKYGPQFKAESYITVHPATLVGIERYLGSGLVKGIGAVLAERLVGRFGLETLEVIDTQPERLTEVEGIGTVRCARIREAWREQRAIRDVMVFLQTQGVSTAFAVKIYRQYRDRAIAVVRENPYRLAEDIFGIGFKTADRIAQGLGIPKDAPQRAEAGVIHVLGTLTDEGHVYAPMSLLVQRSAEMLEADAAIVQSAIAAMAQAERVVIERPSSGEDAAVYLTPLQIAEAGIAALVREILAAPARPITIDAERAVAWFEEKHRINLAAEQRAAIRSSFDSKVLVITGGPGTGKTTLVNGIITILERKGRRILLAAPTGRAAKRMEETTGKEAKTIHRLLEFSPKSRTFQRDRANPLEADLVIVDEASMLDTVLAYNLLKAIPARSQVLFVGDVDQIPSVGPGNVLLDLIRSEAMPIVRLTEIFRQAEKSLIVVSAHRVNRGEMPALEPAAADADFHFIAREEPEQILATIKDLVVERIPKRFGLDPVRDIQVLTPMHRGLLGAASLNAELQAALNPDGPSLSRGTKLLRSGDKVMQIRNNYELEVFNGDIGRIVRIDDVEREVEVRFDGRAVVYDYAVLDELILAYASSIHKAQGSEYPCVIVPLHTQHYVMLQRNLLYTAITRGKRLVVLTGSKRAVAIAVRNAHIAKRFTRLAERLARR